jgi:hypothetical protein
MSVYEANVTDEAAYAKALSEVQKLIKNCICPLHVSHLENVKLHQPVGNVSISYWI